MQSSAISLSQAGTPLPLCPSPPPTRSETLGEDVSPLRVDSAHSSDSSPRAAVFWPPPVLQGVPERVPGPTRGVGVGGVNQREEENGEGEYTEHVLSNLKTTVIFNPND